MKNRTIIIRVKGGLGNQLYIYAFAIYLSSKIDGLILLETRTGFIRDRYKRKYILNNFSVIFKESPWYLSLYYPLKHRLVTFSKFLYRNVTYINDVEFYENPVSSLQKIKDSGVTFLDGYWQDSSLLTECENIIKQVISLKFKIPDKIQNLTNYIQQNNSVAIHFRRVKYDTLLDIGYYLDAINKIKEQVSNPVFFVFSDDINWCRQHFLTDCLIIFVDNGYENEIADFWLMSQCKHFIIANSTFSWWGAWLSGNIEKIIIAPKISNY
jgi:hypothetical protein